MKSIQKMLHTATSWCRVLTNCCTERRCLWWCSVECPSWSASVELLLVTCFASNECKMGIIRLTTRKIRAQVKSTKVTTARINVVERRRAPGGVTSLGPSGAVAAISTSSIGVLSSSPLILKSRTCAAITEIPPISQTTQLRPCIHMPIHAHNPCRMPRIAPYYISIHRMSFNLYIASPKYLASCNAIIAIDIYWRDKVSTGPQWRRHWYSVPCLCWSAVVASFLSLFTRAKLSSFAASHTIPLW